MRNDSSQLIFFGLVFSVVFFGFIYQLLKMRSLAKKNYAWYCEQHPSHVVNGRVHCCHCFCPRIAVHSLMQRTFLRAHVCCQCGETLYYSKEKR